jgi:hypothetical protein
MALLEDLKRPMCILLSLKAALERIAKDDRGQIYLRFCYVLNTRP